MRAWQRNTDTTPGLTSAVDALGTQSVEVLNQGQGFTDRISKSVDDEAIAMHRVDHSVQHELFLTDEQVKANRIKNKAFHDLR